MRFKRTIHKLEKDLQLIEEKYSQKLSKKQKKLASAAPPLDKITGADFKALRDKKKQKNENLEDTALDEDREEIYRENNLEEKRKAPKKDRKNPPQYSAPEGSKRDEELDRAAALYAKGDIKGAARVRKAMEEPHITEEVINDMIEEIKLYKVLQEYEDTLNEKRKKGKSSKGLSKAVKKSLDKKADKRCLTRGSVYAEFRAGLAAFLSSGSRKGMSAHQWAHARVNSAQPRKKWARVKKRKKCPKKK